MVQPSTHLPMYVTSESTHTQSIGAIICFIPTLVIDCGPPQPPTNGYVSLFSGQTHVGDLALYTCGSGYMLLGNQQRMCQENGQWSGNVPDCQGEV